MGSTTFEKATQYEWIWQIGVYEIKYLGYLVFDSGDNYEKFEINFIPFLMKPLGFRSDAPWLYGDCDQLKN